MLLVTLLFINQRELSLILFKLIKDGFVETKRIRDTYPTNCYYITFEGVLFKEQGGYDQKLITANQAKYNLSYQISLYSNLNRLTFWIAFGTSVAAVYYGIEIGKWIYNCFH